MTDSGSRAGLRSRLLGGGVIPAIPLALDARGRFDERRQRALVRYYIDSGVLGIAAGVHTTQFEIRDPRHGLFEPVLGAVSRYIDEWTSGTDRRIVKVGGVCGKTDQALGEAEFLARSGFDAGLLSLAALRDESPEELVRHAGRVADIIPVVGFYLQPAVGGRHLPHSFWRDLASVEGLVAVKIAPFNRYFTMDVVRAVAEAGRAGEVALYTGNDDSIVIDLVTTWRIRTGGRGIDLRFAGGLLGQWSVWTKRAVELVEAVRALGPSPAAIPSGLLTLAQELTDANGALFDVANGYAGCIPGIHEILRRQGFLEGTRCLDPCLALSPGQAAEIDRVCAAYPHLTDDDFVRQGLPLWMS